MEVFNDGTPTAYGGSFVVGTPPAEKPGDKLNDKDKEELKKLFDPEKARVDEGERRARESGALPPLPRDPKFRSVRPTAGNGNGEDSGVYVPPISGPSAEINGTVVDDANPGFGPKAFYVATVDGNGERKYFSSLTDIAGRFRFRIPTLATKLAAVEVFRRFDRTGQPDRGGRTQVTDAPIHLPGSQTLQATPAGGPAILEANSAYDRAGESAGIVQLQARGIDPRHVNVHVDGRPNGATTLAASDRSVVARLDGNLPLGRHTFTLVSSGRATNAFPADVITQRFDPLPPMKTGNVYEVRLHVEGVGRDEHATVVFTASGGVELATGGPSARVPLQNGIATVRIKAVRNGTVSIRTRLETALPQFAPS